MGSSGRRFLLLVALVAVAGAQKKKCYGPKELEEANMDFFKNELDRTNTEFKDALNQKAEEIGQFLTLMKTEYSQDKTKYGCILEDLKSKLGSFDPTLYNEIRDLPKDLEKLEERFEVIVRNLEQDHFATNTDVEKLLLSLKALIMSELKVRLNEIYLKTKEMETERTSRLVDFETRISGKLESTLSKVEEKLTSFLDDLTENNKKAQGSVNKEQLDETIDILNSSLAAMMGAYFGKAEEKMTEIEQGRDLSFHDLDDKISELIWPLANDVKTNFQQLHKEIGQVEQLAQHRSQEATSLHNETTQTIEKIASHMFSSCFKTRGLELITLATGKYFISTTEASWYKAQEFCADFGMQLASIETEEERAALQSVMPNKNHYYWLSGSDIGHIVGNFYWTSGYKVDETWWSSGQPNDFEEGKETCIELHTMTAKLIDYKCSDVDFFICEAEPHCALVGV